MANWTAPIRIPRTKLLPPQLAEGTLHRAHLLQDLHQAVTTKRLMLLTAPAGAGKTTSMVALHAAHPELSFAWATLDEGDNEPNTFLQVLIAAIQTRVPEYGREVQHILDAAGKDSPDPLHLMGVMVNGMAMFMDAPFILVLDDLHRVEGQTIHRVLDYLLERMPPNVHVVLATRHDPPLRLAQLRARGQMAEFRLAALRFSIAEVTNLLNEVWTLGLSPADLQLVYERTEGWAAGLRLLTLSLPRLDSPRARASLIQHLSASHRFLFDYLIEEVLDQLEVAKRVFLLQTSILDELTPAVCNAVTQRRDAAVTLDALYRQNLFLVVRAAPDPFAEPTYTYHALFAQFLQKLLRQQPEMDLARLHMRAANAVSSPERRIHHLLAAEAWNEAAEAIIALGKTQCDREFVRPYIIEWMDRLPVTIRQRHYWLDLIKASYLRQRGHLSEAWQLCKATLPAAQASSDLPGELEALWILSFLVTEQPEPEWARRFSELVAERTDLLSPTRHTFYLMSRAFRALNQEGWPLAQQYFYDYIHAVRATEDPQVYYASAQQIAPVWLFADNGLPLIRQFDQNTLQLFGAEDGLLQAGPYARQGWIALLQGDLTTATELSQRASRIIRQVGSFAFIDLTADYVHLMVMVARSEFARLEAFVQEAESRLQKVETHRRNLNSYWLALWRAYWLQDRWEDAHLLIAKFVATLHEKEVAESPTIALLEGWQAHADKRPLLAEEKLVDAVRRHRRLRWIGTWGNAGVDLALFYLLENRPQEALVAWREAAAEMKKREMPGQPLFAGRKVIPVLELAVEADVYPEIARVSLSAFGVGTPPQKIPIPGTGETLTPREVEVLQLLMSGATNQQIADQLVITKRTAKAHLSNILQKLQVSSRTEAVARAHALSLL
ncbi:MAG: hypothetical protein HUU38_01460 [Anaerolineales bacterium]|nr:hypothetical protein [Anaerolineales bacterium]